MLSAIAFLIVAMDVDDNGNIVASYLDSKGLFTAIFIAIISVKLYQFFTKHKLVIKMPEGVPDFVSSSFELITPTAAIGVLFIVIRAVTDSFIWGVFFLPQVIMDILAPAIGSLDSLWVIYLVLVLRLVFWFWYPFSGSFPDSFTNRSAIFVREHCSARSGRTITPCHYEWYLIGLYQLYRFWCDDWLSF